MMQYLGGVGAVAISTGTAALLAICVVGTYISCVAEGECVQFLPMISDTFVYPPGSYLSRLTLSVCGIGLALILVIDRASFLEENPTKTRNANVVLFLSLLAAVAIGIVGAVCESDSAPTCLGNGTLHTTAAVYLYVWLSIYAAFSSWGLTVDTKLVLALASIATKIRYLPMIAEVDVGSTALAIVEWLDTAFLCAWLILHSKAMDTVYEVGFTNAGTITTSKLLTKNAGSTSLSVIWSMTLPSMTSLVIWLSVLTVAVTFVISVVNGDVAPQSSWPYISDLWVKQPNDMISRYFVCLGGYILMLTQIGHYYLTAPYRPSGSKFNVVLHGISVIAGFGLCCVGACNEKEDRNIHDTAAAVFFGGFGVYAVLDILWDLIDGHVTVHHLVGLPAGFVCIAYKIVDVCLKIKVIDFAPIAVPGSYYLPMYTAGFSPNDLFAVVEWAAWIAFLVAMYSTTNSKADAKDYSLSILRSTTPKPLMVAP